MELKVPQNPPLARAVKRLRGAPQLCHCGSGQLIECCSATETRAAVTINSPGES